MTKRWRFALVAAVLGALLPILTSGTASAVPTATSFTPTSGGAGTSVAITGSNFIAGSTVTLNGKAVTVSSINATTITFTIPASASSGQIKVTDSTGSATAPGTFTVTAGVCCSRTVTPAASFPINGTALDPSSGLKVSLYKQGDFVTNLAATTTDATGGFSLASLTLPPEVTGGTYDLIAATEEKAASVTITVQPSWLATAGTARGRNAQRFESLLGYDTVDKVDVDWLAPVTGAYLRPLIVAGLAIIRTGPDLLAVNATTGVKAWRSTVGGDGLSAPAALGNSVFASTGSSVRALAVSNGATQWTATCSACPSGTVFGSVAAADGIVVASAGATVRAFNAANGAYLWSGSSFNGYSFSDATASIVAGTVVIRNGRGVTAFDLTTGNRLWELTGGSTRWFTANYNVPTQAGTAFVNDSSDIPTAYGVRTTSVLWSRPDLPGMYAGSHAVGDGVALYSGSTSNVTVALSTADGSTRWSYPTTCGGSTYANGVFYAVCSGGIHALDASDGRLLAKFGVQPSYYDPPAVAGGTIYVTTGDGLVALNVAAANK